MKFSKNKNGYIAIEVVVIGALIVCLGFYVSGGIKDSQNYVASESVESVNDEVEKGNLDKIGTTAKKKYEEKVEEDMTDVEKNNANLINPNRDEYAGLNEYR